MDTLLKKYLGSIEEIHGHLMIVQSHSLLTLDFLSSLRYIAGKSNLNETKGYVTFCSTPNVLASNAKQLRTILVM